MENANNSRPRLKLWNLKFAMVYFVVVIRFVGLVLTSIWMLDCYLRESHMIVLCKKFTLFPDPNTITSSWFLLMSLSSICWIVYVRLRLPQFPGFKIIFKHMLRKQYFYKILFVLVLVLIYDVIVLLFGRHYQRTFLTITFMLEHITTVTLVLTLNFVPNLTKNSGSRWNMLGITYIVSLAIYILENYSLFVMETIAAAYNVISTPSCIQLSVLSKSKNLSALETPLLSRTTSNNQSTCRDAKSAAMLVLHLSLIYLRHLTGNFFLTKIFRENYDILRSPLKPIVSFSTHEENRDNSNINIEM